MFKSKTKFKRFNKPTDGAGTFEIKKKDFSKLKQYCIWLLGRKAYGRAELGKKLSVYAENQEDVDKVLDEMEEYKYIDDNQYATMVLNNEINKGRGKAKILQTFKNKGLDTSIVEERLSEVNWFKEALELKVKKFGSKVETDQKLKAKQIRFLQYRGFGFDVIMKVINHKPSDEIDL